MSNKDDITFAKINDSNIHNGTIVTSTNGFTSNYLAPTINSHEALSNIVSRIDTRFTKSYNPLTPLTAIYSRSKELIRSRDNEIIIGRE